MSFGMGERGLGYEIVHKGKEFGGESRGWA